MNLNDYLDILDEDPDFEETPVDLETFLYDDRYLGKSMTGVTLSPIQADIVERGSQIYKKDTLIHLLGKDKGADVFENKTSKDLILALGKGSGKDFIAKLIAAYAVHKLLCLRDPALYFGKPPGDNIDIVNLALNADQASRVYFTPLRKMIEKSPWFSERLVGSHIKDIEFDKSIFIYSLHSSFEAAEGLNIILTVLDEIAGFEVEGYAEKVYKALSGTVSSRFPHNGKVIRLSFPRRADDHMMKAYKDVVKQSEIVTHSYTFKLDENLEDGEIDNEFSVSWDEEHVVAYKFNNVFAIKAPTFKVNPIVSINDYKMDFLSDEVDTLMRVCANPPDGGMNAFFKNHQKLEEVFSKENGWSGDLICHPREDTNYYIHVDLSQVVDRCVVSIGHVDKWVEVDMGSMKSDPKPYIVIDLFRVWEPTKNNPVNHGEVMEFIQFLCKKFNVRLVTFDQWHSFDHIRHLNDLGISAEKKSLGRPEYQEFLMAVSELRMEGPHDERFLTELKNLVILPTGKVDHPNKHHNDISESVCGVVRNCIENEDPGSHIKVITLGVLNKARKEAELQKPTPTGKVAVPSDIAAWINSLRTI